MDHIPIFPLIQYLKFLSQICSCKQQIKLCLIEINENYFQNLFLLKPIVKVIHYKSITMAIHGFHMENGTFLGGTQKIFEIYL